LLGWSETESQFWKRAAAEHGLLESAICTDTSHSREKPETGQFQDAAIETNEASDGESVTSEDIPLRQRVAKLHGCEEDGIIDLRNP